jgi:hypothetical protein
MQPEEVRGLARSGDLSRMLPSEIMLMAHGWPRKPAGSNRAAAAAPGTNASDGGNGNSSGSGSGSSTPGLVDPASISLELESLDEEEYYLPGEAIAATKSFAVG